MRRSIRHIAAAAISASALLELGASPALAHHAMGGGKVTSVWHGLLSGLAHPVIGLDHFCFLLAIGAAAAFVAGGAGVIATFMVASSAGVVLHLANVGLAYVEPAVAVTVLAAGVLLLLGDLRTNRSMLVLALVGGVLHGYALAESIVGVETTPLAAYLVGLTIVQATVTIIAMLAATVLLNPDEQAGARRLRWAGAAVCLAGAYFLVSAPLSA